TSSKEIKMFLRRPMTFAFTLWMLIFAIARLEAQVTTASIYGTVTDTTGAVIPGVEVKATHIATNFSRPGVTDHSGQYTLKFLPVGEYRLDILAPGFKAFAQTGIVLEVNRSARVDAALQVGEMAEKVLVTSDAPMVNTTDASLGRTVDNAEIVNLPL